MKAVEGARDSKQLKANVAPCMPRQSKSSRLAKTGRTLAGGEKSHSCKTKAPLELLSLLCLHAPPVTDQQRVKKLFGECSLVRSQGALTK